MLPMRYQVEITGVGQFKVMSADRLQKMVLAE